MLFLTYMVLLAPFNHSRHARASGVVVVLKKRIPSAPMATDPLELLSSAAITPRFWTYASPVTRFHCEPGVAETNMYQS